MLIPIIGQNSDKVSVIFTFHVAFWPEHKQGCGQMSVACNTIFDPTHLVILITSVLGAPGKEKANCLQFDFDWSLLSRHKHMLLGQRSWPMRVSLLTRKQHVRLKGAIASKGQACLAYEQLLAIANCLQLRCLIQNHEQNRIFATATGIGCNLLQPITVAVHKYSFCVVVLVMHMNPMCNSCACT